MVKNVLNNPCVKTTTTTITTTSGHMRQYSSGLSRGGWRDERTADHGPLGQDGDGAHRRVLQLVDGAVLGPPAVGADPHEVAHLVRPLAGVQDPPVGPRRMTQWLTAHSSQGHAKRAHVCVRSCVCACVCACVCVYCTVCSTCTYSVWGMCNLTDSLLYVYVIRPSHPWHDRWQPIKPAV